MRNIGRPFGLLDPDVTSFVSVCHCITISRWNVWCESEISSERCVYFPLMVSSNLWWNYMNVCFSCSLCHGLLTGLLYCIGLVMAISICVVGVAHSPTHCICKICRQPTNFSLGRYVILVSITIIRCPCLHTMLQNVAGFDDKQLSVLVSLASHEDARWPRLRNSLAI